MLPSHINGGLLSNIRHLSDYRRKKLLLSRGIAEQLRILDQEPGEGLALVWFRRGHRIVNR